MPVSMPASSGPYEANAEKPSRTFKDIYHKINIAAGVHRKTYDTFLYCEKQLKKTEESFYDTRFQRAIGAMKLNSVKFALAGGRIFEDASLNIFATGLLLNGVFESVYLDLRSSSLYCFSNFLSTILLAVYNLDY